MRHNSIICVCLKETKHWFIFNFSLQFHFFILQKVMENRQAYISQGVSSSSVRGNNNLILGLKGLRYFNNFVLWILNFFFNTFLFQTITKMINTCLTICCCFLCCLSSSDPRNGMGVRSGINNWHIFSWIPSQSVFWCSGPLKRNKTCKTAISFLLLLIILTYLCKKKRALFTGSLHTKYYTPSNSS